MFRVTANGNDVNPYRDTLINLFSVAFPDKVDNKKGLFDVLTDTVIGTKQHRYGPTPNPETLVSIREVIRQATEANAPIPIIVPWGASKQGPYEIDIAEVMALKQLSCLQKRVQEIYKPGVLMRIRLEDLTDNVLFNSSNWEIKTYRYTDSFLKLVKILDIQNLEAYAETKLMVRKDFEAKVSSLWPEIYAAMNTTGPARQEILNAVGWIGSLPQEQIDHYQKVYANFYSHLTAEKRTQMIAQYFACALARRILGGIGNHGWTGLYHLTLCFTPPTPGMDTTRRLFYRTMPERFTNNHRAPWIGKGYVRIYGNESSAAIAGWTGDEHKYNPFQVTLEKDGTAVQVAADYVVMD